MKTHRCEGSLKAKISIRFSKKSPDWNFDKEDYETWRLFHLEYDSEYDTSYLSHVSKIDYCPFCGKKLD